MYFKRIDMHGFKSFAEPVSIEFHEGITCIVGPNGSGKSNISDAIRWVLGEQSPKMLRGGKMEEVIFAGTASRKSRGMAEVTLVIDNGSAMLPIDYAEVAITRRMYRSGESEYYINGNSCRLRDIRELIMDTGIGVDGYSLIGQGKIAEIVSNKPESRREIFEEAAGIVKYRSKKEEAERKMVNAENNLDRVKDIVGEIEARIGGLKEDSEKAAEYLILKDRYKTIEINSTLKHVETIELKNEYIKDDISSLDNQIAELKEYKETVDSDISQNKQRSEELDLEGNQIRDHILKSVEEINALVNESQLTEEKDAAMEKDLLRLTEEIAGIEAKLAREAKSGAELEGSRESIQRELESLSSELAEKSGIYSDKLSDLNEKLQDVDYKKSMIYELNSEANAKNTEISSLRSLQGTLQRRKDQLTSEADDGVSRSRELQERHEDAQARSLHAERKAAELAARQEEAREAAVAAQEKERALSQELSAMRVTFGQLSARKKIIEEMENSYEGYNNAVRFIMKSKQLTGINGVVGELMKVPKNFAVAIETALGASLQNIICEDDRSAQKAIASLKENRAGRLTFLPLASIRPGRPGDDHRIRNAQGFQGMGVSCVEFEEKYRPVMEYLLGRIVIVDKLENAVLLAKNASGGLRFVTLEGDVINPGGAITGGTVRSNTGNLLARRAEAEKLGESLIELQEKQRTGEQELESLGKAIAEAQQRLADFSAKHREAELSMMTLKNEAGNLAFQLTDYEHGKNKRARELASIEEEKASSEQMISVLREQMEHAASAASEMEQQAEVGLAEYTAQKDALEAESEEITRLRLAAGTAENKKNHLVSMLERVEQFTRELTAEKEEKEEQIRAMAVRREALSAGGEQRAEDLHKREAEKAELEERLKANQNEKELIVRYLGEITGKKDAMDSNLFSLQSQKHELSLKLAKNETQVDSYKDRLWEEYEISYIQAMDFKNKEFDLTEATRAGREIKNRMKELGEVNIGAIKEYESVNERYEFLTSQRDDLLQAIGALKQIIDDMDRTIRIKFKESFDRILANFEVAFQELFGGGSAELRLEDENRPLECGIEIVAQPPGKKLQNINLMSGGEKTMTAIALMFAVLKAKPTPFCILDEVEAALDDMNIDRFAKYLRNFREIQFALVTHQKATMEFADVLYGVTMPEQGISKVISLRLGDEFEL